MILWIFHLLFNHLRVGISWTTHSNRARKGGDSAYHSFASSGRNDAGVVGGEPEMDGLKCFSQVVFFFGNLRVCWEVAQSIGEILLLLFGVGWFNGLGNRFWGEEMSLNSWGMIQILLCSRNHAWLLQELTFWMTHYHVHCQAHIGSEIIYCCVFGMKLRKWKGHQDAKSLPFKIGTMI